MADDGAVVTVTIEVTDQFCGAGGSSIGAESVEGVTLKLAMNHWRRAIETHEANFPHAEHDCADISATDPRRYPRTDVLLTSPECTNHSLAKGTSRKRTAPHIFELNKARLERVEAERSRATMWDVPRFAEYHDYDVIVVENVVEARDWSMFPAWWQAMELLGYEGRPLYLNSMFFPPTPQSRDRMYVVWKKRGMPEMDLDYRPSAFCPDCTRMVDAVQTWKRPERPWGRYRTQYVFTCPECRVRVEPAYTPAFTAIDWSDLGQRIGDRAKPLAPATIGRIKAGLERYSSAAKGVPFIAELRGGSSDASSVREALATIVASGNHHGLVVPDAYLVRNNKGAAEMVTPVSEHLRTLTTKGHQSLLVPPEAFVMVNSNPRGDPGLMLSSVDKPLRTQTASQVHSLVVPYNRTGNAIDPEQDALGTFTGKDRFALVMANRTNGVPKGVDEQLQTICTGNHLYLIVPTERGSDGDRKKARLVTKEFPTQTARQTLGFAASIEGAVEDCGFRMLQPHEIGAGMAFPQSYIVTGNKRERVKQYGNAVTPPVMRWILGQVSSALGASRDPNGSLEGAAS